MLLEPLSASRIEKGRQHFDKSSLPLQMEISEAKSPNQPILPYHASARQFTIVVPRAETSYHSDATCSKCTSFDQSCIPLLHRNILKESLPPESLTAHLSSCEDKPPQQCVIFRCMSLVTDAEPPGYIYGPFRNVCPAPLSISHQITYALWLSCESYLFILLFPLFVSL